MLLVCVLALVTLTTFALCGLIVAMQSFLLPARAISKFAFACDCASVAQPGPIIKKSTATSSLFSNRLYDVNNEPSAAV